MAPLISASVLYAFPSKNPNLGNNAGLVELMLQQQGRTTRTYVVLLLMIVCIYTTRTYVELVYPIHLYSIRPSPKLPLAIYNCVHCCG